MEAQEVQIISENIAMWSNFANLYEICISFTP